MATTASHGNGTTSVILAAFDDTREDAIAVTVRAPRIERLEPGETPLGEPGTWCHVPTWPEY